MIAVPTNRDYPWLRDENAARYRSGPEGPKAAAQLHLTKQLKVIDDARDAPR